MSALPSWQDGNSKTSAIDKMSEKRTDIQGLRALAVGAVLLFHVWPGLVPGGYVGVDVFFVISGYLITGVLFREAVSTGSISLTRFYERRIRRLLPAATAVLLAVTACLPLLPQGRWQDTAYEIAASTLYVENWRLAWLKVDYLGAENEPSPVQHYWSLSIEEQFYIVWPLVIVAVLVLRRGRPLRTTLMAALASIAIFSFAASVILTSRDQSVAYFVTHTRMWELALGGLLALAMLPSLSERAREGLRVTGLAAIAVSFVAFSSATEFPGVAALLPTLGCALVIAAGTGNGRFSSYRLLASSPAQHLGDISYSVYLWHWPLIVFAGTLLSEPHLSLGSGAAVLAATLLLSWASYRFIEQPFRRPGHRPLPALLSGAASIAGVVLVSGAVLFAIRASSTDVAVSSEQYPGALALLSGAPVPQVDALLPPLAKVRQDLPDAYRNECHLDQKMAELNPCVFGPENTSFRVLLSGDSHAANWIPALRMLAEKRGWRVETHTKSSCQLLVEPVENKGQLYQSCLDWGQRVLNRIAEWRPDVVLVSQTAQAQLLDRTRLMEEVVAATWNEILKAGVRVVGIAETPWHDINPVECLQKDRACASDRQAVTQDNRYAAAAAIEPRVPVIDMMDTLCTATECPMVIGNVVVWRDRHHLTASYSRTLADALGDRVMQALGTASVTSSNEQP